MTSPNPLDLFAAEYSPDQQAFHIQTVREMMQSNLTQIIEGWSNGYLCIGVAQTHEQANQLCEMLKASLDQKSGKKPQAMKQAEEKTVHCA